MDEATKSIVYKGYFDFEAQGRAYRVRPMSLRDIATGEFEKSGIIPPMNKENSGQNMLFNMANEVTRKAIGFWLEKYAEFDGAPLTLDTVYQHEWDLRDVGKFIQILLQISG